ncbi:protein FAM110A [Denticeps clupeoides]|uniref:protein FAM110A n=1 Tax=Denticeps clupeoides TaxID=299321 RepID=UPI0010A3586A|nr:protein FAM110A-like [Denticeps clupeoides]
MPVEAIQPSYSRSIMPFRILNKGPDYFRQPSESGVRKLSAVERLEADKAKYVKSQHVALTRQEPVQPPVPRKPLLSPNPMRQCRISSPVARRLPDRPAVVENCRVTREGQRRGPRLNLEILNNLINVCDGPPSSSSFSSGHRRERTPLAETPSLPSSRTILPDPPQTSQTNRVTVRRVDVHPKNEPQKPCRSPLPPSHHISQLTSPPSPLLLLPPPSPAFTLLSSGSSCSSQRASAHKLTRFHRSKSDLSDRYSRAPADLERFFNYCGLDATELEALGDVEHLVCTSPDIKSLSKLHSVSTPRSECGEEGGREEEENQDIEGAPERVPYRISIIERNARVIKWLYGIRQARDRSHV